MQTTFARILWFIAGLLLIFTGVYFIFYPDATLLSLSVLIGVSMLIYGVFDLIIYARMHRLLAAPAWMLVDGLLDILVGLLFICNDWLALSVLPFLFSMWVMVSGISKTVQSLDLRMLGIRGWGWLLALGVILIVLGFLSLFKPMAIVAVISVVIALSLIAEGVFALFRSIFMDRFTL